MARKAAFAPSLDLAALAADKLAQSGLTTEHARALGIETRTAEEMAAAGHWRRYGGLPAIRLPYQDPWTKKPSTALPGHPAFYRVRALTPPPVADPNEKFPKYLQTPNTGVMAYFPAFPHMNWSELLSDPSRPLIITEGELKAAAACAVTDEEQTPEFPTIGLGGVYSFISQQLGQLFLPDLAKINWVQRYAYIVFDSDIMVNPDVSRAAWRLAQELEQHGAFSRVAIMPNFGGDKTGLDDLLVKHGPAMLHKILASARPVGATQVLFDLNEKYAVVREGKQELVDRRLATKIPVAQIGHIETGRFQTIELKSGTAVPGDIVAAANYWLSWPLRTTVDQVRFAPSQPPRALLTDPQTEMSYFNTWTGFAVQPRPGNVEPFLELIDHLFQGGTWEKDWLINWLAYPIKHLGTKMFTACVVFGLAQGSGKTLVAETMRRIYGRHFQKITQRNLQSDFNDWADSKLLILGDEITGVHRHEIHDELKVRISQTEITINKKHVTPYLLDDFANYYFTSNRAHALYLDQRDRRIFVWEVPSDIKLKPRKFFIDYMRWLDEFGGAAFLLDYLLKRDTGDFDPGAPAPETRAKVRMREESRGGVANWAADVLETPDEHLLLGENLRLTADIVTVEKLILAYAYYENRDPEKLDTNQFRASLGHSLSEAGAYPLGTIAAGAWGKAARWYAVRNPEKWRDASLEEVKAHLKKHYGGVGPVKGKKF